MSFVSQNTRRPSVEWNAVGEAFWYNFNNGPGTIDSNAQETLLHLTVLDPVTWCYINTEIIYGQNFNNRRLLLSHAHKLGFKRIFTIALRLSLDSF